MITKDIKNDHMDEGIVHRAKNPSSGDIQAWVTNNIDQIYYWNDFLDALKLMITDGIDGKKFYIGKDGDDFKYGLVNIAAFLAQCMQETIQYNACDENNWSGGGTTLDKQRTNKGQTQETHRKSTGEVSEEHRESIGQALEMHRKTAEKLRKSKRQA